MSKKASYFYKLVRVGRGTAGDVKVTTVSICPVLYTTAVKAFGDPKSVGAFCREAVRDYNKEVHGNRSGYVTSQLRSKITSLKTQKKQELRA